MIDTITSKPFTEAARELVLRNPALTRKNGNPDWRKVAALAGIGYESLRKALAGERPVSDKIMRAIAKALAVKPEYFFEFRAHRAQDDFNPKVVGLDQALWNLSTLQSLSRED